METDQLGRLRDILEAARLIGVYVKDTRETDFRADKQKQDAVIRRIEIIGEAAAHVTEATRRAIPELAFFKPMPHWIVTPNSPNPANHFSLVTHRFFTGAICGNRDLF